MKPRQLGRVSIRCRSLRSPERSKNVLVLKQVNKETQTVFVIFRIEDELSPTYKIENRSESI